MGGGGGGGGEREKEGVCVCYLDSVYRQQIKERTRLYFIGFYQQGSFVVFSVAIEPWPPPFHVMRHPFEFEEQIQPFFVAFDHVWLEQFQKTECDWTCLSVTCKTLVL